MCVLAERRVSKSVVNTAGARLVHAALGTDGQPSRDHSRRALARQTEAEAQRMISKG